MKNLVLIRHAKSSWEHSVLDKQRPLADEGKLRAQQISNILQQYIDLSAYTWYTSPARRALETAQIFQQQFGNSFHIQDELYTFNSLSLQNIVGQLWQKTNSLAIFGHNPAFTEVGNLLGDFSFENLPTSGVVAVQCTFEEPMETHGKTLLFLTHKQLMNAL